MTWSSFYSSSSYPTTTVTVIETITPTQFYPSATSGQWTTTEASRIYPTATATTTTTATVTASMLSFNPTAVAAENTSNDSIPYWLKALLVLQTIALLMLVVLGFIFMKKRRSQQTYEPAIELKNAQISYTEQYSDIPVGIPIDLSQQRGQY
eukprot:CAMPEP_0176432950 /NCGR_PEP_ID=MMETSP0127-20121128/15703_1 /TAXON_ID=938130 /ORGANISM="Platyophrya macrostoma, Strain WH" /LENGTH=151 /DNA_ID=CAMNT_0017815227 /DNA_START=188 /DNA_END=643 /DNA_ORIENTATION=+